jgi:hypothetical protein
MYNIGNLELYQPDGEKYDTIYFRNMYCGLGGYFYPHKRGTL